MKKIFTLIISINLTLASCSQEKISIEIEGRWKVNKVTFMINNIEYKANLDKRINYDLNITEWEFQKKGVFDEIVNDEKNNYETKFRGSYTINNINSISVFKHNKYKEDYTISKLDNSTLILNSVKIEDLSKGVASLSQEGTVLERAINLVISQQFTQKQADNIKSIQMIYYFAKK
jgi:hypothetical protein